ncbi:outer membrane lipase/esterase [Marinospirillum celere]|uniref:Outer membrane lipase/esterase n=2 Tax=Marinospirillum celere TaxID=1122252 RepID=A0A1I1HX46_9GAMM|nr:outer membrane lipase/esterase [Marinospirillum celere]
MKFKLTPLAAAALLGLSVSGAQASSFDGIVVFGDSLSDSGQFPDGTNPQAADFNLSGTRLTNRTGEDFDGEYGQVATQFLTNRLGLGPLLPSTSVVRNNIGLEDGSNYAVAGLTSKAILSSIVNELNIANPGTAYDPDNDTGSIVANPNFDDTQQPSPTNPPYLRSKDGYLVANGGQADANKLYYINGGANDFINLIRASNVTPTSLNTAVQEASENIGTAAISLANAGAKNLVVSDMPNLARTPLAAGVAAGLPDDGTRQGFLDGLTNSNTGFNNALGQYIDNIDTSVNVVRLDVNRLFDEFLADPEIFGFAPNTGNQLTSSCFDGSAGTCGENPTYGINGTDPDPSKLLFNDAVHPTEAAQEILGDHAASFLIAPQEISLIPQMGQQFVRNQQAYLSRQADYSNQVTAGGWQVFGRGGYSQSDYYQDLNTARAEGEGHQVTIGGLWRVDDALTVALAISRAEDEITTRSTDSKYESTGLLLSVGGSYTWEMLNFSAQVSYADLDIDAQRGVKLGQHTRLEEGSTDGSVLGATFKVKADLLSTDSAVVLSPFAGLAYSQSKVDGYEESEVTSTSLTYGDLERTSFTGELGIGLRQNATSGFNAELAFVREFDTDATEVSMYQQSYGEDARQLNFTGYTPEENYKRLALGYRLGLTDALVIDAGYNFTYGDERHHNFSLGLAFSL